jgi:hypothetical protein
MKPRVHYADMAGEVAVGQYVRVIPVNHPDKGLNGIWVYTSLVQAIWSANRKGPVFETLNTVYAPAPDDDTPLAAPLNFARFAEV